MTVVEDSEHFSPCSALPSIVHVDDHAVVVVTDREAELKLMDKETSTCLEPFLRLDLYAYTPPSTSSLRVTLDISGLTCSDPGLLVYIDETMGDCSPGHYGQCGHAASNGLNDGFVACAFICCLSFSRESIRDPLRGSYPATAKCSENSSITSLCIIWSQRHHYHWLIRETLNFQ